MIYFKVAIFLAFSMALFLFPLRLYRNRKFRRAWLGLAYSENFRLFTARLLCLMLILFHLAYYALFPTDKGIMLSTAYVFFSLASKKNMMLLQAIRRSRMAIAVLAITAIVLSFVPHLLSVAITLAFTLEAACCFPSKAKRRKHNVANAHLVNADTDEIENLSHS